MDLHKFGIKLFAVDADKIDILKLIPMYHRWIQQDALDDLLIDVADYSHVPAGPGIMLIAHEGNYALDETGHERGVVYYSKQPLAGELPERFARVASKALQAAQLMTEDAELKERSSCRATSCSSSPTTGWSRPTPMRHTPNSNRPSRLSSTVCTPAHITPWCERLIPRNGCPCGCRPKARWHSKPCWRG